MHCKHMLHHYKRQMSEHVINHTDGKKPMTIEFNVECLCTVSCRFLVENCEWDVMEALTRVKLLLNHVVSCLLNATTSRHCIEI